MAMEAVEVLAEPLEVAEVLAEPLEVAGVLAEQLEVVVVVQHHPLQETIGMAEVALVEQHQMQRSLTIRLKIQG